WPAWIPWTVFGGGLAVLGIGGLVQLQASGNMDAYDRSISRDCVGMGCKPDQVDGSLKDRALTENKIAVSVMTVGIATAAVGGVMLYMNRGKTVYEGGVEKLGPGGTAIDFKPTHDGGGLVTLSGKF